MIPAVIIRDPREETLIYWERFENTIREAIIGYQEKTWGFSIFGFVIGLQRITIYQNTLDGWHWPHKEVPFTDEDKASVLKAIDVLLTNQGYQVRTETWNPKVRILNIGPED